MAENTKIEWAHHTFNPWIGCTKVSPGCDHCYAEASFDKHRKVAKWGAGQVRHHTAPSTWAKPKRWNAEAERLGVRYRVFCSSLADVFDNEVPAQWRVELFKLIEATPNLDWLLLTKRIGNAAEMMFLARGGHLPLLPNVWIGASITSQAEADRDIPKLLAVPAAKRFLSMEPLLGPVDLLKNGDTLCRCDGCLSMANQHPESPGLQRIDWVIVGGESGPNARPMHPDWARALRDQCQAAGVPFMFKQWGEWVEFEPDRCETHHMETAEGKRLAALVDGFISKAGEFVRNMGDATTDNAYRGMSRVGKKAAGRLLDGREWNEVPA